MKTKPPAVRRIFANPWDQIGYLHDRLLFWLYQRGEARMARRFTTQMDRLLADLDPKQESILGQECRSLISEAKVDLEGAIKHRTNEIQMIRRLQEISRGTPSEAHVLKNHGVADLSDRLDLLAVLYRNNGDLQQAIEVLRESKALCQSHGIAFDGGDLLRDYLAAQAKTMKMRASGAAHYRPRR